MAWLGVNRANVSPRRSCASFGCPLFIAARCFHICRSKVALASGAESNLYTLRLRARAFLHVGRGDLAAKINQGWHFLFLVLSFGRERLGVRLSCHQKARNVIVKSACSLFALFECGTLGLGSGLTPRGEGVCGKVAVGFVVPCSLCACLKTIDLAFHTRGTRPCPAEYVLERAEFRNER